MRSITLTIIFLFVCKGFINAQNDTSNNFRAYKTAFFTERLELTPQEAEKFWPVYHTFHKASKAIKSKHYKKDLQAIKAQGGIDALTDEQAKNFVTSYIDQEKQLTTLKVRFYKDLEDILPPKKILKLHKTEYDFRKTLLHEYKRKKRPKPSKD